MRNTVPYHSERFKRSGTPLHYWLIFPEISRSASARRLRRRAVPATVFYATIRYRLLLVCSYKFQTHTRHNDNDDDDDDDDIKETRHQCKQELSDSTEKQRNGDH